MSRNTYIVLVLVLAVYALLGIFHPRGLMAYAFPSAAWGLLALITLWISGPKKIRQWFSKQVSIMAAIIAALQIFILIDAGIFTGFGKSPFSFTLRGITINIIFVYTALLGTEFTRAYLIKNFSHKKPTLIIGLITLLYTLVLIPITGLPALLNPITITLFLSSILLPLAAENLLASYLAFLGGPIAALAYRAPLKAFWWFSPILPDLPWYIDALIGIVAPTAGFLIITYTKPLSSIPTAISIRPPSTIGIRHPNTLKPRIRAKQDENEPKQKKKTTKKNKKLTALFLSILTAFLACSLAYSYWTDTLDISGTVTYAIRDIATINVTPDTRRVYAGPPVQSYVNITVEAKNNGTVTETFNVTAYYDSTQIGTQTVNSLEPNQTKVLNFIWNTTEMTPCTCYCLSAEADTVPWETRILNNVFVDACVWVTIPGDIDCDGDVDYDDFIVLAGAYGSSSGQLAYRLYADFDCDGDVDYDDFIVLAAYYGKTC